MKFKVFDANHKVLRGNKAKKYLKKMAVKQAEQVKKAKLIQEIKEKDDYYEDEDFIFTLIR